MDFEEKVTNVEHLFDGKVIDLDRETVTLPNGKKALREIVRHHGAVGVIAITPQVTLEIPAGKIEPDEQNSPLETATRELNEEARYMAKNLELVMPFYTSPGFADEKIYLYHASGLSPVTTELPQDEDEFLEKVELTLPEALKAMQEGLICDSKTIMAVMFWQLMN